MDSNSMEICFPRTVQGKNRFLQKDPPERKTTRLAATSEKLWHAGCVLTCKFLEGTPRQKQLVEKYAKVWEDYANISFQIVDKGPAEIRIAFTPGQGSWSAVGNDALREDYFPLSQPTMNFGWLYNETKEIEFQSVVLHEFGHALGCEHEHQSPASEIEWDVEKVLKVFSGAPNYWTEEQIRHNIINRLPPNETVFGEFDPKSIMLYQFDGCLINGGNGTRMNDTLSDRDNEMIETLYPFN